MSSPHALGGETVRLNAPQPAPGDRKPGMRGLLLAVERLHKGLQQSIEELLVPHGLSLAQWLIISSMVEEGGDTLTHFSRHLDRDAGSLSRAIYLLSQRGLLTPRRDPRDRRSSRLSLTPEGQRIHQDVLPRITALLIALDPVQVVRGSEHASPVLDDLAARVEYCRQQQLRD